MQISRTFDAQLIYECLTHDKIWKHLIDDGSPEAEFYFPPMAANIYWLAIKDGEKNMGVICMQQVSAVTFDVHLALLPCAWGRAVEICNAAIGWTFKNTDCMRIIGSIPQHNHHAISLAKRVGFEHYGTNKKSFLYGGILYDELLFGLSRG